MIEFLIEFCRNLAINIFWVLAAVFQVTVMVVIIASIITRIAGKTKQAGKDESEKDNN